MLARLLQLETQPKTETKTELKTQSNKKVYPRYKYNLADGANVVHIPNYVGDPNALFDELRLGIDWEKFKHVVYEKEFSSPRLMCILKFDKDISDEFPFLDIIKRRVEKITHVKFRYAVLNYYRDGNDHIGYHSDREVANGNIVVSVSVGATRRFKLKHKYRDDITHTFLLANGDVLILNTAAIKTIYKHSVPKMANVGPRINITFRE